MPLHLMEYSMSNNRNNKPVEKPLEPQNVVAEIKPEAEIVADAELEADVKPSAEIDADAKDSDSNVDAEVTKFKTNHNGLFVIDGIEFKQDEVKELSSKQLESKRVQHAIKIGALIEV
jgi:hypothetical protein